MPIYEYQCDGCGEVFEVFQKFSDPPPTQHACGSNQVRRIMSQTSFILKGSGWYITDYGRGGGRTVEKSESSSSSSSSSSDSGSSKSDKKEKSEKGSSGTKAA